ncbi:MAG: ComEC/Rec2 family competence protein [Acidobacteriota bacterium]|nr:ComEC/Rec2 family competence protein [Blastocatellia bacterium]MDW8240983.1 ComEC/Rec2 family competence protein [Acidobacteriota bacterium]
MRERFAPLSLTFQPMLFVAAAYCVGIALAGSLNMPLLMLYGLALICCLIALVGLIVGSSRAGRYGAHMTSAALLIGFVCAGGLLFRLEQSAPAPYRIRSLYQAGRIQPHEPVQIIGVLSGMPVAAPERVYLDIEVQRVKSRTVEQHARGRVRLMLPLTDEVMQQLSDQLRLSYGVRIRALTTLQRADRYRNPGSFEYTEFLDQRGFDASGVLKSPRLVSVLARDQGHRLMARLYEGRRRAEAAIDRLFDGQTAAILKAVFLGNRYFLSRDVAERFRAGGTFHLLVISGSHVSFLAAILIGIFSTLWRNRWFQFVAVSGLLWAYTLMVGLDQAPIVRATVMTTVALVALIVFRQAQAANMLGVAAFILLVIKPSELFAPGFQLTCLAVASMVLLAFPLIARWRAIGTWRPSSSAPYPPQCPPWCRWLAEVMYWDQRAFDREQQRSPIRFRVEKAALAQWINRLIGVQPLLRAVCLSLVISSVVQIVMLPAMILYFHRVTLAGVLLNVTVSLFIALLMLIAFLAFAIAQLNMAWASPLVKLADWLASSMNESMQPLLQFRWASFRVAEYTSDARWVYGLYFVPLVFFVFAVHRWQPLRIGSATMLTAPSSATRLRSVAPSSATWLGSVGESLWRFRHQAAALLLLFNVVIIVTHPGSVRHQEGWLTVSFLDVGQGDAVLIQFPQGASMLVDSGGRPSFRATGSSGAEESDFIEDTQTIGEAVVSNFLWAQGITRIDYALPTHADTDHIQGFSDVFNNFSVGRVLLARLPTEDAEFTLLESARRANRIPIQAIAAGDRFSIDGVAVDVLWPPRVPVQPAGWGNDESVVMKLTYGHRRILLTGDITEVVEQVLMGRYPDLSCDVLKVPHHGSRTSSSEAFIDRVRPRDAVIPVGAHSPFRHPHQEVVARYRARRVRLWQTGHSGTITIRTDGTRLEISTHVRQPSG